MEPQNEQLDGGQKTVDEYGLAANTAATQWLADF
jgi:hypothetical protein